jgi:TfoX/Sxy family transcriptional regulator of competence genes
MASDISFVEYVKEQIESDGVVTHKKMFGEYLIYINAKPAILICDNTAFVKVLPELEPLLKDAPKGFPYQGAKEYYVIDPDDDALSEIARIVEKVTPVPKPKKRK